MKVDSAEKVQKIIKNFHWNSRKLLQVKVNCLSSQNISSVCGTGNETFYYEIDLNFHIFTDRSDNFEGTFRRAIWPFLVISQLYGVMPVSGVTSWSISDLHFKWKSMRTIYAIVVACILSSYSLYLLWKIFTDIAYFNIIGLTFAHQNDK